MAGTGWEQGMKTEELNSDHISPRDFTVPSRRRLKRFRAILVYIIAMSSPILSILSSPFTYGNPTGFPRESNATASTRNYVPPTVYRLPPADGTGDFLLRVYTLAGSSVLSPACMDYAAFITASESQAATFLLEYTPIATAFRFSGRSQPSLLSTFRRNPSGLQVPPSREVVGVTTTGDQ
ncbi:hypothetical protein EDD85DRAFT_939268 [Armillaria nabsnona]|nr:hypothetical protein EDD85DRAFT_939268 [Armillaria nabsnona]